MFTGIVACLGKVRSSSASPEGSSLCIAADNAIISDLQLGDSVAVNGVCQTVVRLDSDSFYVQVSHETLSKSKIGELKLGESVNLETALKLSTPLGGHLVLGHVDGIGVIQNIVDEGFSKRFVFSCGDDITGYIVPKGSVAVEGVSLTIASVNESGFSVSVIPHTLINTVLQFRTPGDKVNLEADIIGKYVVGFLEKSEKKQGTKSALSLKILEQAGFL